MRGHPCIAWYCIVSHGIAWYSIVSRGIVLDCIVWYCMVVQCRWKAASPTKKTISTEAPAIAPKPFFQIQNDLYQQ